MSEWADSAVVKYTWPVKWWDRGGTSTNSDGAMMSDQELDLDHSSHAGWRVP